MGISVYFTACKRRDRIPLLVICTIGLVYFVFYQQQKSHKHINGQTQHMPEIKENTQNMSEIKEQTQEMAEIINQTDKVKGYDVLLSGYMRSGSTLSGIVLGSRDDSFFLYEPLWKCARWVFWRGNSTLCKSKGYECRDVKPGDTLKDNKFYGNSPMNPQCSLDMARNILHDFYDCRFNNLESQAIVESMHTTQGGPGWNKIRDCKKHGSPIKTCIRKYAPNQCKEATHRVSKVLRLSTDIYGPIMEKRKNLKVFHLFRDPRAIVNSRMHREGFKNINTTDGILDMTRGLCDKMLYDFHEGKKLLEKYPDRFKFLFYEDINDNPLEKVKAMYRFVGMSLDEKLYTVIKHIPVFTPMKQQTLRQKNTAFWWRESMDWKLVQEIDDICTDVYEALGYISLKNLDDFRDLSISSINLAIQYLL